MVTVTEIAQSIRDVGNRLRTQVASFGWNVDTALSQYVGSLPPLTSTSVIGYSEIVATRVEALSRQQLDMQGFGVWLAAIHPQLNQLSFGALSQGQPWQVQNALTILSMIDAAIPAVPPREPKVNWEDIKDQKSLLPRDLKARLKAVETRLTEIEPRSQSLAEKISDIEAAHGAANELPTDLAELAEQRKNLETLINESNDLAKKVLLTSESVQTIKSDVETKVKDSLGEVGALKVSAQDVLERSEHALRGATSVGLSKSFSARASSLDTKGFWWTIGLIVSLLVAVAIGWERMDSLKAVLGGDKSATVVIVNALLAVLGIGAPVWFAWLSTKQIGLTSRLAEDYAFKASVAQAYEGYRTEAVAIDENLQQRLFAAALDRLEELPSRLVENVNHSTPLQEILSNPTIQAALEKVPHAAEKILSLISEKGRLAAAATAPIAGAVAALKPTPHLSEKDE